MTVRKYLWLLTLITIISWVLWFLVITYIDPDTGSLIALSLFYATLFLSLMGTFSIIGYLLRLITSQHEITRERLNIALRQGVLFSLLVNISLYLKAHDKLGFATIIITILILSLIEFFFLSMSNKRS